MANDTLGITGHRKFGKDATTQWAWDALEGALARAKDKGFRILRDGMAPGTDIIAGELALGVGLAVHAVIPFPGYAETAYFTEGWHNRYYLLLEKVTGMEYVEGEDYASKTALHDNVTYVYGKGSHMGAAFAARNKRLADPCSAMIAVYDGRRRGGTVHAMNYALKEVMIPVYVIDPVECVANWRHP